MQPFGDMVVWRAWGMLFQDAWSETCDSPLPHPDGRSEVNRWELPTIYPVSWVHFETNSCYIMIWTSTPTTWCTTLFPIATTVLGYSPVVFPDSVEGGIPYTSGSSLITCRGTRMDSHLRSMPGIFHVVSRLLVCLDYTYILANRVDLWSSLYPTVRSPPRSGWIAPVIGL